MVELKLAATVARQVAPSAATALQHGPLGKVPDELQSTCACKVCSASRVVGKALLAEVLGTDAARTA